MVTDNARSAGDIDTELTDYLDTVEIPVSGTDEPIKLGDMMGDIMEGHYELDAYRNGALTFVDGLETRMRAAKRAGDDELVELLEEIRDAAVGLHDRIDVREED